MVCTTSVPQRRRSFVHWRIKIQETMMHSQQKRLVKANVPWTRRLPHKPTEDERLAHLVTHLPFRPWCSHCVKGLARDWPHRGDYGPPPDIPMVAMDFCIANTESDDDVLTILTMKEKPFQ